MLPGVRVSSEARMLLDPIVVWEVSHVAVLVGPVLALRGALGSIGVASTFPAGHSEFPTEGSPPRSSP